MDSERVRAIGAELKELKIDFREQAIICVFGHVGVGKTAIAKEIGSRLGIPVLSSNDYRKAIFHGAQYEVGHSAIALWRMIERSQELFRSGVPSVVLDATFSKRKLRANVDALARRAKKKIIWVEVVSDTVNINPENIDGERVPREIDEPIEIKKRLMVDNSVGDEDYQKQVKRLVREFVYILKGEVKG